MSVTQRNYFVEQVFRLHHRQLYAHALNICRRYRHFDAVADDLMQNFYQKLLERWQDFKAKYEELGIRYFLRVLSNALIDIHRSEQKRNQHGTDYGATLPLICAPIELDAPLGFGNRLSSKVRQELSQQEYEILEYKYVLNWSCQQIADELQIPRNTVGTRLYRSRQKIKFILEQRDKDTVSE